MAYYEGLCNREDEVTFNICIGEKEVCLCALIADSKQGWTYEVWVEPPLQPEDEGCPDDNTGITVPGLKDFLAAHPALVGFTDTASPIGVYYAHKTVTEQHFKTAFIALALAVEEFAEMHPED